MGYTTDFKGSFELSRPLAPEHDAYLKQFSETRRMMRNESLVAQMPDPVREAVGLEVGPQGAYFVGAPGFAGQDRTEDIVDYNEPPRDQPGLWCQWVPNDEGTAIVWNEAEKFYNYVEWLEYLVKNFLSRWGYQLNGKVIWQGEETSDSGVIYVKNNQIKAIPDELVRKEPDWETEGP